MQSVKVDSPHATIRARYRNPTKYIGSAWRGGMRRDFNIGMRLWLDNPSCPLVTPLMKLRRS